MKQYLTKKNITVVMVLYICIVFINSLRFKFTNDPETQHIFGTLDMWAANTFGFAGLFNPGGIFSAVVIGSAELVASTILLVGLFTARKVFVPIGAAIAAAIMTGAISFHLFTPLGVEVIRADGQGDGGALFIAACGIWLVSLALIWMNRQFLPIEAFNTSGQHN